MSDIRYREVMEIRPASNYKNGKKKKKKKGMYRRDEADSRKAEFSGIISNSNLDSHNTHIGERALRSFAKKAKEGVPILGIHDRNTQIGRSTSGTFSFSNKNVSSDFYIQRGLPLNGPGYSTSDAYIDSIDVGTMRDLSVGFIPKQESCDHCGSEMKRFNMFGLTFTECDNGHYPGKRILVDKNGKETADKKKGTEITVTSTINEADLKEFSVVPFGSTPGAEIAENVMRAFNEGKLEEKHRIQLNEEYQMRFDTRSNKPLIDEFLKSIKADNNQPDKDKSKGGHRMAIDNKHIKDLLDRAIDEKNTDQADALDQLAAERDEYYEELERLREEFGDEEGNIDQNFIRLNEKIDQLETKVANQTDTENEYVEILETTRLEAMYQFDRKHKFQASPVEREQMEQRLHDTNSYHAITALRDAWKDSADAQYIVRSGRKTKDDFSDRTDQDTADKYSRARVSA